jgi:hypothetical protein
MNDTTGLSRREFLASTAVAAVGAGVAGSMSTEMEAYGFSDYFGIGDVIGHTEGGYLHDDVISAGTRSWLRGQGEQLRADNKPWFMAVNLINPHDVMYYNTDLPGLRSYTHTTILNSLTFHVIR